MKTHSKLAAAIVGGALFAAGAATGWAQGSPAPVLFIVQLQSEAPHAEVVATMQQRAPEFRAIPGLSQKHYLHDPEAKRYAGVYLFRSQKELDQYLGSELRKSLGGAYKVKGAPEGRRWELLFSLR
jgi:hypothetical protein